MKSDSEATDKLFTKLLQSVHHHKYEPTKGEIALAYRCLSDSFHPLGAFWACFGGFASFVFHRGSMTVFRRCVWTALSASYSYEISSLTSSTTPSRAFFQDLPSVEGSFASLVQRPSLNSEPRFWWEAMFSCLTLQRTVSSMSWLVSSDLHLCNAWLLLFKKKWFAALDMDPCSKFYWKVKLWHLKLHLS